jgi:hypothetical protein
MAKKSLTVEQQLEIHRQWLELREVFPDTIEGYLLFAQTVIHRMIPGNPDLNRLQADICKYLYGGPLYRMVQAQRGQSKTILAAIYACFSIMQAPSKKILIVSQKAKRAKEIANWCIKIFNTFEFLHFMLPDKNAGDRESIEAFDIHWVLRGDDKSASISCESIESGIQGARADILIADDIESLKNSRTEAAKELLEDSSKEFESINREGDIIYLGTPQYVESIYNNLSERGYDIRIWTGRYPHPDEWEEYGGLLAPMLMNDMERDPSLCTGHGIDGQAGAPTCPEMFDDENLTRKEVSQGKAKFKLQYMLNTTLSDEARFPLKLKDFIVTQFNHLEGPEMPIWASGTENLVSGMPKFGTRKYDKFYKPIDRKHEWRKFSKKIMYIDPAGGGRNGDETAYAIVGLIGVYAYIIEWDGIPGGYDEDNLMRLVKAAKRNNCKTVVIEKNMGNGSHMAMLKPLFEKHWKVSLEDRWESGQKELRIIDVIEPLLTSHRLVVSPTVIRQDANSTAVYPLSLQKRYRGFFQLGHITRERDCLAHDDRVDALAGALRELVENMDYDMQKQVDKRHKQEILDFILKHQTISGHQAACQPQVPDKKQKADIARHRANARKHIVGKGRRRNKFTKRRRSFGK